MQDASKKQRQMIFCQKKFASKKKERKFSIAMTITNGVIITLFEEFFYSASFWQIHILVWLNLIIRFVDESTTMIQRMEFRQFFHSATLKTVLTLSIAIRIYIYSNDDFLNPPRTSFNNSKERTKLYPMRFKPANDCLNVIFPHCFAAIAIPKPRVWIR